MSMENLNQNLQELHEKLEEMNARLEDAREERNNLLRERFDLKEQRRYLRGQLRESNAAGNQDRADRLSQRLEDLKEKLEKLDARIEDLEHAIDTTDGDIDVIRDSLEDVRDAREEAERTEDTDSEKADPPGETAFNGESLDKAIEKLNLLVQKGLKKVADALENVDLEAVGQKATQAAKTVTGAAADAARSVEKSWNEAKDNRGRPGGIGDYRISGSGVLDGGCYNRVAISGSGTVSSHLVCRELKASGSFRAHGDVDCSGEIRASGSFHCDGNLTAGGLSGSGSVKIDGDLKCGLMNVPGSLNVGGGVTAGEARVTGGMKVGRDFEAESLNLVGSLNIGGILNAEAVNIRLAKSESTVSSIGGAQVTVSQSISAGLLSGILKPGYGCLTCESIEGDDVDLSGVKAKTVRGNHVVIHSGCMIDVVEYTETCSIEDGAVVGSCAKV